jgi:hypothetical protein
MGKFTRTSAQAEARSYLSKNMAIDYWAAAHGGIYVPATDKTPPNPCLSPKLEGIAEGEQRQCRR